MDHRDIVDYSLLFIVTGIGVNSNDCSVLCISYEKGKKHTERYYIGVKNRATKSEYSIKK